MNILPFVFSILLVLSFSAAALFQKHFSSRRSHTAFLGLRQAELSILRQSEEKQFQELPGIPIELPKKTKPSNPTQKSDPAPWPVVNPVCSRLNLYPLIIDGRTLHPALYDLAANTLRLFYHDQFGSEKRMEYRLLDALLAGAKKELPHMGADLPLETIPLSSPSLQLLYYKLLKGTKHSNLFSAQGYPSLIDFFKIEQAVGKICLFHAHPHMLTSFFGLKSSPHLYQLLHQEKFKAGIELEALLLLANDPHLAFTQAPTWDLLDLTHTRHNKLPETLVAEDEPTGILLRHSTN